MTAPRPASVVVPTRGRSGYLTISLASIVPQARALGVEVLVVLDGPDRASGTAARRAGARVAELPEPRGANAARNLGVAETDGATVVFVDDDVDAPEGWLAALLAGLDANPDHDVVGGPIAARLEGGGPRTCGREAPPITALDLGRTDRDAEFVWSANMAVRRSALERVGPFDERLRVRGDEEDWLRRLHGLGGRVRYVAAAGLVHRRTAADSRLPALARAAWHQGRAARRYDVVKGVSRASPFELRILLGCLWHTVRRNCPAGLVMAAHSAGRLREALAPTPPPPPAEDFLSGHSGGTGGVRRTAAALAADAVIDARRLLTAEPQRLRHAAARVPRRRVLALAIERTDVPNVVADAFAELVQSRHDVRIALAQADDRGKFENLSALLAEHDVGAYDWLLVLDDDVVLPRDFLDSFLFLAERFELGLAQPAHRRRSDAAFEVTRRRAGTVVRETGFVEIGPVFAFTRAACEVLLPFPPLRAGWGLELHWTALARRHGLRQGVVDAVPISHRLRPIAASYSRDDAVAEARAFLADRPYVPAREAARTVRAHARW